MNRKVGSRSTVWTGLVSAGLEAVGFGSSSIRSKASSLLSCFLLPVGTLSSSLLLLVFEEEQK